MSRRWHERTELKCVSCFWHKPREGFRETPWHGRAARCLRCEGGYDGVSDGYWRRRQEARTHWELEQTRQKLRAYQRYAQALRRQRYDGRPLRPWERVVKARRRKWAPLVTEALSKAHTLSKEEA